MEVPSQESSTAVDTGEEIFFTTKSSDAELLSLLAVTRHAALQVLRGEREGPISLGWTTEDTSTESSADRHCGPKRLCRRC